MKVCASCGLEQPLAAFHRDKSRKDGRASYCKACRARDAIVHAERQKAYNARYYNAHRGQRKATNACYYKEHPEIKLAHASYRAAHVEQRRTYGVGYRRRNLARLRAYDTRYYKEHPERNKMHTRCRRARKQAVHENFSTEMAQFVRGFWCSQCAVCGATEKLCIDHWLPLSLGHALTVENAVLLCSACNSRKGARLPKAVYAATFVATVAQCLREQAEQWAVVAGAA